MGVILKSHETDPTEYWFEGSRGNVTPVEHPFKFTSINKISLEGGQKNLGRITEDDDAERYWKLFHVETPLDLGPAPVADLQEAVAEDNCVYEQVRHRAPKAQVRYVMQWFQKSERYQEYTN